MTIFLAIVQALLLVLLAPLVRGIVGRLKASLQNRQGASIWRPYWDLAKLFRKEDLVAGTASPIFRIAPVLVLASSIAAAAFVPVLHVRSVFGFTGDFVLLVYLLAMGRFFLLLGAFDGGSAFGGMGASREALVSTLAEAPLLLGLTAVSILAQASSISGIAEWTLGKNFFEVSAVHVLALSALTIVMLAEAGRIPVDNPTTHLELTMIHEGMVLEYSGPSLALVEWANAIKLTLMLSLLIALFAPWGIATSVSVAALGWALAAYAVKILLGVLLLAIVESSVAKLRMYLVPDFLGVATALSILAVIFTMFVRR
ncbi:MAG: NADH-quinone oxidoreductase subunit H [Acidobacteriales bacterium]|nr:NADH-quinone oxidoreductase subunit H [Terriglobales bacterium]